MNDILVSVVMITYGHEAFIEQAINSVLMQECKDFNLELIIADDCSPDNTKIVVENILKTHPKAEIIKYKRQAENIGMVANFVWALKQCKGKYIALCEGDDYWTDSFKLHKQVEVLENNEDCVACHHWHEYLFDKENENSYMQASPTSGAGYLSQKKASLRDIFMNKLRVKTRTVVYRNIINEDFFPPWFYSVAFADVPLSMLMGRFGNFYFIDEVMAVYRITDKGVSTIGKNSMSQTDFRLEHFKKWIRIWDYCNKEFKYLYNKEASQSIQKFNGASIKLLNYKDGRHIKLIWFNLFERKTKFINRLKSTLFIVISVLRKWRSQLGKKRKLV